MTVPTIDYTHILKAKAAYHRAECIVRQFLICQNISVILTCFQLILIIMIYMFNFFYEWYLYVILFILLKAFMNGIAKSQIMHAISFSVISIYICHEKYAFLNNVKKNNPCVLHWIKGHFQASDIDLFTVYHNDMFSVIWFYHL